MSYIVAMIGLGLFFVALLVWACCATGDDVDED